MNPIDLTKFETLTLEELRTIATEVGIQFSIGNELITDKEQFLFALDESSPEALEMSFNKIIKNRKN